MLLGQLSFFFSSRRRHTRSLCDWSSDVCSSDLSRADDVLFGYDPLFLGGWERDRAGFSDTVIPRADAKLARSEERRVGKEGGDGCRRQKEKERQRKYRHEGGVGDGE